MVQISVIEGFEVGCLTANSKEVSTLRMLVIVAGHGAQVMGALPIRC